MDRFIHTRIGSSPDMRRHWLIGELCLWLTTFLVPLFIGIEFPTPLWLSAIRLPKLTFVKLQVSLFLQLFYHVTLSGSPSPRVWSKMLKYVVHRCAWPQPTTCFSSHTKLWINIDTNNFDRLWYSDYPNNILTFDYITWYQLISFKIRTRASQRKCN
jgi:hypothetical protein